MSLEEEVTDLARRLARAYEYAAKSQDLRDAAGSISGTSYEESRAHQHELCMAVAVKAVQ